MIQLNDVPVTRLDLGRVLLGWDRPVPVEGVAVAVEGVHLTIDPARPGQLPACLVTDGRAAEASIRALYGADAAAAVGRVWAGEQSAVCSVTGGETLDSFTRLAIVRWCRQFSTLPLDETLLWLEERTLVGALQPLLEDEDEWASELERAIGWLIDRADGHLTANPVVEEVLIEALDLLATTLPVVYPVSIRARARLASHGAGRPGGDPVTGRGWSPGEDAAPLALVAGEFAAAGTDTVDWFDVPRGVTSMTEGNVRWAVDRGDEHAEVRVVVVGPAPVLRYGQAAAQPEPPALDRLAFEVHVPRWPFAVLAGRLAFDAAAWAWSGGSRVGDAQADLLDEAIEAGEGISVRVRSAAHSPAQNPAWAHAHRWACRGLSAARVAGGSGGSGGDPLQWDAASAAWSRAAELWFLAGQEGRAEECERLRDDFIAGRLVYDLTAAEAWLTGASRTGR